MTDLRLGKLPATHDRRDLLFADFQTAPYPEARVGFGTKHQQVVRDWGMLGNGPDDSVAPGFEGAGDCVLADAGHRVIYSNALAGKTVTVTGKETIADYSAVTGYVVGDDSTDQGTNMRDGLNFARKTGILAHDGTRHRIGGYCALEARNWHQMLQALAVFDVVSIGFEFPSTAFAQLDAGKTWTYVPSASIEGGHDVLVTARPGALTGTCVTWGQLQKFSRGFYEHYVDEAYGVFLPESMVAGKSPSGFDMAAMKAALAAL